MRSMKKSCLTLAVVLFCLLCISGTTCLADGRYVVSGTTNYLALRSGTEYNAANEIGKLYNGETVEYVNSGEMGTGMFIRPSLGNMVM